MVMVMTIIIDALFGGRTAGTTRGGGASVMKDPDYHNCDIIIVTL